MYALVMTIHVVVCIFLIIVVLLQSGKAADLAGAFGGMGSQTAFGPRGSATLLSKATTMSAILFMVTSLSLSILATRNAGLGTTVLDSTQPRTVPGLPKAPVSAPGGQAPISAPLPLPVNATPAAPASQPIKVNIPAPSGGQPGKMEIDMKDIKLPAPPAPPAKK
jgi:preprotein translocase subunit SecG